MPGASHVLAGVCPGSWEQVSKEGEDAPEMEPQTLQEALVDASLSMSLQAKDSDDDDEVTVSVDRDRFMDEFFEQVRDLFLQCSFKPSSELSVSSGAGCRAVVQAPTAGWEQWSRWGWGSCPG